MQRRGERELWVHCGGDDDDVKWTRGVARVDMGVRSPALAPNVLVIFT